MQARRFLLAGVTALALVMPPWGGVSLRGEPLDVRKDDCIIFLGNTFAERMQLFGYFETFLHCRFPGHRLRIRNMGWSADEVDKMIRPLGFPNLFNELEQHPADLIFLCFGLNESFAGPARLDDYRRALDVFLQQLRRHRFNGQSAPRLVLVSPLAYEQLGDELPDGAEHNRRLRLYSDAMAELARRHEASFVDLFSPTSQWMAAHADHKLTVNGIHLSEHGDWVVSQMLARSLGLMTDTAAAAEPNGRQAEQLRRAVYDKNCQFFQWWHPPNASYIHGRRNQTQGAKHLAAERTQRRRLIKQLDQKIWEMPKPAPAEVWRRRPIEGQPIWHPTAADRRIAGVEQEAQLSVPTDGDSNTHVRSPTEQLEALRTPPGYKVNLFASEVRFPIANPMAIQFDARGRLWVANTPTWPHSLPGKQPRDSIVILEDTDRDGVADKHSVFLDKMNLIHGFALFGDGAYVAQTPNLILARDTDGDGRADWRRVVLHGFGGEDAEHSMNNFRWSPGGSIFFTQGRFLSYASRDSLRTDPSP